MFIITKSKQLAHVALPVHFTLDMVCKTITVIALILENFVKNKKLVALLHIKHYLFFARCLYQIYTCSVKINIIKTYYIHKRYR